MPLSFDLLSADGNMGCVILEVERVVAKLIFALTKLMIVLVKKIF